VEQFASILLARLARLFVSLCCVFRWRCCRPTTIVASYRQTTVIFQ